ncbi:ATP-dependent DNA helicase RecG [Patescibacteria group bacterium]|nr:ATP-dependent DNA helicase RecG [Patescibacteria group bacterium]
MITLKTPITELNRVGKTVSAKLKKLDLVKVEDLIYWYPFRYDDFSNIKKINELKAGDIATIKGRIELLANKRSPRKRMIITECFVTDETGSIKAIWFRQPFITKILKNNDQVYLAGQVEDDLFNLYFKNPSYEKIISFAGGPNKEPTHTARMVPIYSTTEGLSQKQIRFLIKQALGVVNQLTDWLPQEIKRKHKLIDLKTALADIHFPKNQQSLIQAQTRLKFDELLNLHLQNFLIKKEVNKYRAIPITFNEVKTKKIVENLGFTLTDAQRKSAWQILMDMTEEKPANRLLEGDVGSGKTVVAALAIANAVLNGYQAALLAPTEILAAQHFQTFKDTLKVIDCNIALLTHFKHEVVNTTDQKNADLARAKILRSLRQGELNLIIGTHALIQQEVEFNNLALVIIDEQHRFGVKQRQAIREKSGHVDLLPHFLSMTATPIPRTLALTLYGDLDLSLIDELPPGRKKPITKLVDPTNRQLAYDFILKQIQAGRQAFVICPLIDESDKLGVKSATQEYQKISQEIFPQLKIGLMHGRLKPAEKDEVMKKFTENKIQILVSTSVVEVGVNIPNANVMIIESAKRFGLAQLHQFRGRVNRSHHQSYCFLFTEKFSAKSMERLKKLVDCYDGFKLAEEDLKLRGTGDLSGIKQSGFFSPLKIASLGDVKLIAETKKASKEIIEKYSKLIDKFKLKNNIHPE